MYIKINLTPSLYLHNWFSVELMTRIKLGEAKGIPVK